jgi:benzoyl-CoA-dihydrodiol lyase
MFCTVSDGVQGQRAKDWRLVDEVVKPAQWEETVQKRAHELALQSDRPKAEQGVALTPLMRSVDDRGLHYEYVDVAFDRTARTATFLVKAPEHVQKFSLEEILAAGANWWPLQMARELDDAILSARTNELELGLWIIKTSGNADAVIEFDRQLEEFKSNWFVREVTNMIRRTLSRLDVSSRSIYAVIEEGSCFAGTLFELALAADRAYMLNIEDNPEATFIELSGCNFGPYTMANQMPRIVARFYGEKEQVENCKSLIGKKLTAEQAMEAGLVTAAPDDLDWADELRLAIESRATLSPDALTGLEANLRFGVSETLRTRIFGRLSAWQNWIFIRPNAVGTTGALKVYGSGTKAKFNWERV